MRYLPLTRFTARGALINRSRSRYRAETNHALEMQMPCSGRLFLFLTFAPYLTTSYLKQKKRRDRSISSRGSIRGQWSTAIVNFASYIPLVNSPDGRNSLARSRYPSSECRTQESRLAFFIAVPSACPLPRDNVIGRTCPARYSPPGELENCVALART